MHHTTMKIPNQLPLSAGTTYLSLFILLIINSPTIIQAQSPLTIHPSAVKFDCPTTSDTPTRLSSLSSDRGNDKTKYILLSPTPDTNNHLLCTLTRVDDEFNKVYVPISRSYGGDDWTRVKGYFITQVFVSCGTAQNGGEEYNAGDYLCQVTVPPLGGSSDGYYLTRFEEEELSDRTKAARFLERNTWGATWEEIQALESEITDQGDFAYAKWVHNQVNLQPTSHRAYFRNRLSPRTVESYQYGIAGPQACVSGARYRRFAFTYKDVECSRGSNSGAGSTSQPYTPMEIETTSIGGKTHYMIKWDGNIRTILDAPLQYEENGAKLITLPDGKYTICSAEEVVGTRIGENEYPEYAFQVLVGDLCTSSYTNRGGTDDKRGDGSLPVENIKKNGKLVSLYDSEECNKKCWDKSKVKMILSGNPEITIPDAFDKSDLSWIDLSGLSSEEDLVNLNAERTHDASWILRKDLDSCTDENGADIPDPAGLANIDYSSQGRGRYNMDKPIFASLPDGKWALHDLRSIFFGNPVDDPLMDAGGGSVRRAARTDDGDPNRDMVTRCTNAPRTLFNEHACKISFDEEACVSTPLPDPVDKNKVYVLDPGKGSPERVYKYRPSFAGPDGGGVVVCGSDNEVAPDEMEDDYYDIDNRKVKDHRTNYHDTKKQVWMDVIMNAEDQLCQRMGWALQKIFATSTEQNSDSGNTETNVMVLDNYVTNCFSTYREVLDRASFDYEMSEQLTHLRNKAVHTDWHMYGKLAFPDQNYARENLQLHTMGLIQLEDDGSPAVDRFGKLIPNYKQDHIFTAAKVWTGFEPSFRRGNYEEQDWSVGSKLDPLAQRDVRYNDWFPKITSDGGYLGDKFPLCSDLPDKAFLRKKARYRLLGGTSLPISQEDPSNSEGDPEIVRMTLDRESQLFNALCNPTSAPLPSSSMPAGSGDAEFDPTFGAPLCTGTSSKCSSGELLLKRVRESNRPNTIDGCTGGKNNVVSLDREAVQNIIVESMNGKDLRGGDKVVIKSYVFAFSVYDRVDFYFAADASNPTWNLITTVAPREGRNDPVRVPYSKAPEIEYTLPKCTNLSGCQQAVRVVLRSSRKIGDPSATAPRNDGQFVVESACISLDYDDVDDLVFPVLPSPKAKDVCDFKTIVTLDENLSCTGHECNVDTVRVVEAMPGVFYEYIQVPCVYLPFFNDAKKVFAGWGGTEKHHNAYMCANPKVPSASAVCCGGYPNQQPEKSSPTSKMADVLNEYRFERLTFAGNEQRCKDWGRNVCNPARIGPFSMWAGHCLHHQACFDITGGIDVLKVYYYHWTPASCKIQVKVLPGGILAIVHDSENVPANHIFQKPGVFADPQSHVHAEKTVSYFYVLWDDSNVGVGKMEYPNPTDNNCDGGEVVGDSCLCDTTVEDTIVFNSLPTKEQILEDLHIGAHDPAMFDDDTYVTVTESEGSGAVSVYKLSGTDDYSITTVFRVVGLNNKDYLYLKNAVSHVKVCSGNTFFFRNAPTFFDIVDPEVRSAHYEVETYLDMVHNHVNVPPFVCTALIKFFGSSNPSPMHIKSCSNAFKTGSFSFTNANDSTETLSMGDGRRGNLAAVAASIVLYKDAISPTADLDPASGGVKSPLLKLMQVMRGFKLERSLHHRRTDGLLGPWIQESFGESPYGIPNQFSFYTIDFLPAGAHRTGGLVAPEAELLNMGYIIASQNALYALVHIGLNACDGGIGPPWYRGVSNTCGDTDGTFKKTAAYLDYNPTGDVSSASDVVGQLATILTADRINPQSRAIIETAYENSYKAGGENEALRVAQTLMLSVPEFHTTNVIALNGEERKPTPQKEMDESTPYKAIVSVFLFGGIDSMSMLVPHPDGCNDLYEDYKEQRGETNFLAPNEMVKIDAASSDQPCKSFGVNKHISVLADIYNAKEGMFFANIGHLQKFVDKNNFLTETTTQLFSHHTMKEEVFKVDAFGERGSTGILGRMHDVLGTDLATGEIAIDRALTILIGDPSFGRNVDIVPNRGTDEFYQVTREGSEASSRDSLISIMREMNSQAHEFSSFHANLWSQSFINSQTLTAEYSEILSKVDSSSLIPTSTKIGRQLGMIYRLIKAAGARRKNRDVFCTEMNGFDQHFTLKPLLHPLMKQVDDALKGFRQALINAKLWDKVTVVLHSEFGRSIPPNASGGTDHGWGGNYFLFGGEVKGGKVLGHHPESYKTTDPHNTGQGAWIPTTPNEAMWYGTAQWFGIGETEEKTMSYVLPNINNFGCHLYSSEDLFNGGTGSIAGCGGDMMELSQQFIVSEPRIMVPDEQIEFCELVGETMSSIKLRVRCTVLDQTISAGDASTRNEMDENKFMLDVMYEVTSSEVNVKDNIVSQVNTNEFQERAAAILRMETIPETAPPVTSAPIVLRQPTQSPTVEPTQRPVIAAHLGYEFVGVGECKGPHGFLDQTYQYLSFSGYDMPDECPTVCGPFYTNAGFRGFQFGDSSCKCLFDNEINLDNLAGSATATASTPNDDAGPAKGPIQEVIENANEICYRMAPVQDPVAPENVTDYKYVGYGNCHDVSGQRYEYTEQTTGGGISECGKACSSLDDEIGFWANDAVCHCLRDSGTKDGGGGDGGDPTPFSTPPPVATPGNGSTPSPAVIIDGQIPTPYSPGNDDEKKPTRCYSRRRRPTKGEPDQTRPKAPVSRPADRPRNRKRPGQYRASLRLQLSSAGNSRRTADGSNGSGPITGSDHNGGHCYRSITATSRARSLQRYSRTQGRNQTQSSTYIEDELPKSELPEDQTKRASIKEHRFRMRHGQKRVRQHNDQDPTSREPPGEPTAEYQTTVVEKKIKWRPSGCAKKRNRIN